MWETGCAILIENLFQSLGKILAVISLNLYGEQGFSCYCNIDVWNMWGRAPSLFANYKKTSLDILLAKYFDASMTSAKMTAPGWQVCHFGSAILTYEKISHEFFHSTGFQIIGVPYLEESGAGTTPTENGFIHSHIKIGITHESARMKTNETIRNHSESLRLLSKRITALG